MVVLLLPRAYMRNGDSQMLGNVYVKVPQDMCMQTQMVGGGGTCSKHWRWMVFVGWHHTRAALPPGRRPDILCAGNWVVVGAGLDGQGKSRLHRDWIPGPSSQ